MLSSNIESLTGFLLAYLHLTLDHSQGQSLTHLIVNIYKMLTDRANITIAVKYEVTYGFSSRLFRFELGIFQRSRSRSYTFQMSRSRSYTFLRSRSRSYTFQM